MATDKKLTYKDQRLTKDQQKKIKPVVQAGTKNFLGKQEMVTVPKKWLSSSDHVVAELAYITPREQKILINKNLYGSLKGKPNVGPGGIMSLQGGDAGGLGGSKSSGGNGGSSNREKGIMSQGKGPKGTTGNISGFTDTGPDKSAVSQFSQYGKNVMAQNLQSLQPTTFDQIKSFYNKLPTPLNLVKNIAKKLGPTNNLDFYNQKVVPAGKTNLGFQDYMAARMAGTIDAYGNPIGSTGGGEGKNNISNTGILQVQEINPIGIDEEVEVADTSNVNNMNFNFGTASNPIYGKDLV
tara:strand:+ start:174 stop:1058 length:885 start_codon:yes stop_codon:yes gene_type:complete